ncbi:MAG TPA: YdcF family protein [Cytophagaceae bacterium]|nr:YdcF family protein [Cytophagaceae bacterium]
MILIFAFFSKNQQRKKKLFLTGIILLIFFSNEFIVNEAIKVWEIPATKISELPQYDIGIVLTGIASEHEPRDRVYLDKGSDRVLHTLQLYRTGKIRKILITGGSGRLLGDTISEAAELAEIFRLCEVPLTDLLIEDKSVNTRENAVFSKKYLGERKFNGKALLITSAYHMRRARLCFNKAGLKTDVFSTDFNSHKTVFTPASLIFPSERALNKWTILFHEVLGMLSYKIAGYI